MAYKRKMGARALRGILEDIRLDIMYDAPQASGSRKYVITADQVHKKDKTKDLEGEILPLAGHLSKNKQRPEIA
jgi:ATP-dependent Clp protease ATP-binding subunit ClpX